MTRKESNELLELKELIETKYTWEKFKEVVRNGNDWGPFKEMTGIVYEEVESYREDGSYIYVFKLNDKTYMCQAAYYSQEGSMLESYDVCDFWEVERATKTIEYWKNV